MKDALLALLASKKAITTLIGIVAVIAARKGCEVDVELCIALAGLIAVLVGAQGAADAGKEAARIHSDAASATPPRAPTDK